MPENSQTGKSILFSYLGLESPTLLCTPHVQAKLSIWQGKDILPSGTDMLQNPQIHCGLHQKEAMFTQKSCLRESDETILLYFFFSICTFTLFHKLLSAFITFQLCLASKMALYSRFSKVSVRILIMFIYMERWYEDEDPHL